MQYQEFIESVQDRAGCESQDEAIEIIRATLETLADHMAGNAPAKLAAQLPPEIGEMITNHKSGDTAEGERFGVQEFVRRVGERAGIGEANTAALFASSVLAIVQDAVSREEFDKVRGTFPDEYNTLFEQENSEAMSTRY
ncbi:MAG: DUF2267 domain-containing protein [Acidobacteriota bacterium]|nr:DUF2267 domain-containing protein [Acidobacteriota bacterium]